MLDFLAAELTEVVPLKNTASIGEFSRLKHKDAKPFVQHIYGVLASANQPVEKLHDGESAQYRMPDGLPSPALEVTARKEPRKKGGSIITAEVPLPDGSVLKVSSVYVDGGHRRWQAAYCEHEDDYYAMNRKELDRKLEELERLLYVPQTSEQMPWKKDAPQPPIGSSGTLRAIDDLVGSREPTGSD